MSAVGLESIDHTVQLTHIWINDLDSAAWVGEQAPLLSPAANRVAGLARLASGQ